jgi:hypothetical protein
MTAPARRRPEQRHGERVEIAVRVDNRLRARQPAAVDQRRVVERVRQDHAAGTGERRDDARVGEESGAEQDARLGAL